MSKIIDVSDLPDEKVKQIEMYVDHIRLDLKGQSNPNSVHHNPKLKSWKIGVKGNCSREEIYEHI